MRTPIQAQAVINGNINYLTSVSNGISAAVAGLPLGHPHQLLRHLTVGFGHATRTSTSRKI